MNKFVYIALLALLGTSLAEEAKTDTASHHGPHPGHHGHHHPPPPPFGMPPFFPPGGPMPPMFPPFPPFPPFPRPFFDSYYCSAQATFALAIEKHYDNVEHDAPSGGYGGNGPSYGSAPPQGYGSAQPQPYSAPFPNPRKHKRMHIMRQACRYSAATSFNSCNQCCQIASHGLTTSSDGILGALFYFDPAGKNPQHDAPGNGGYGAAAPPEDEGSKFVQCICCAPRNW
uniref:Uncharacterized protein n=1 Tax=Parastrongyloides trichosuri TaxID=131310 RepID=A0A0N4Z366_PARTI